MCVRANRSVYKMYTPNSAICSNRLGRSERRRRRRRDISQLECFWIIFSAPSLYRTEHNNIFLTDRRENVRIYSERVCLGPLEKLTPAVHQSLYRVASEFAVDRTSRTKTLVQLAGGTRVTTIPFKQSA